MRVISNKALLSFSANHSSANVPMQAWRKIIESRAFANFSEIKTVFNSVDKVTDYYVFDIGGNKFRIVAAIHFNNQIVFIRHVFTHKEYDKWKP